MRARPIATAILLWLGVLPGTPGAASGQTPVGVGTSNRAVVLFHPRPQPPGKYPASYYFEGAVIGVGVLATTGAWFGSGLCESSDCTAPTIGSAVVFGLLGGTAGAIVGGLFPAPHTRPLRGRAATAALVGATAGALWGFGVFPHFCLNGCNAGEVRFGLSSAAVGALAGLLVGH